ncbi:MAG: porin [Fimbriimonadales bacterium]|nr:porin [Fimbriimonadales bacterium]
MHSTWRFCRANLLAGCFVVSSLGAVAWADENTAPATTPSPASREERTSATQDTQRVQELQRRIEELQKQLEELQREMQEVRLYIEEQSQETIPVIQTNLTEALRFRPGNYMQFQWFDSQENRPGEGFQMRRFRISQTNTIDPRTQMRLSFDVSTGSQRISAELRDAQLIWDIEPTVERVGVQLLAGQQPLPLGYELERSSAEREMPERALYNRTMFAGERGRGVFMRYGLSNNSFAHFGFWNSLSFQDPQQTAANTFANVGSTLAWHAGWRYYTLQYEFGVAGFFGQRPGFTFNDPTNNNQPTQVRKADREFIYVDASVLDFLAEGLTLRGELMLGKDRVPTTRTVSGVTVPRFTRPTNILGYQLQATYRLNYRNFFTVRYDVFDPNTDRRSRRDSTTTWGFAYSYFINPNARLTFAYEVPDEEGTEVRNNAWTIRLQYRY